jgi:hypothetical protein
MLHVFVETNWIVDVATPKHHQRPVAWELVRRAERGELILHVPAISFSEARKTIPAKFQPRNEAEAIRDFLGRARQDGNIKDSEAHVVYELLNTFENSVRQELAKLDTTLQDLRRSKNLDVFPLNDRMLEVSVALSFTGLSLQPLDQGILAGVVGRAEELQNEPDARLVFCEKDADLQPWDRKGSVKLSILVEK